MECLGPLSRRKKQGYGLAPEESQIPESRPSCFSHTTPMQDSIEPCAAEVKKEAFMERIKAIAVNDLQSKCGEGKGGAAGGGAGRSWALG